MKLLLVTFWNFFADVIEVTIGPCSSACKVEKVCKDGFYFAATTFMNYFRFQIVFYIEINI